MTQDNKIIRLFFAKMKKEFIDLSDSEKNDFMIKDRANLDSLGMKAVSMIQCGDLDNEWDYIGVESWPSMEAIQKREKFENEVLKISKYVIYKTHLGIDESFEDYGK
jgi:hypothetical protein